MRALVVPVTVSVVVHAAIVWTAQHVEAPRQTRRHTVPLAMHESKKPPPPPMPPPPRHVARLAPKRAAAPIAPPVETKPAPPPQGYSVDSKRTVEESSVAVTAKEGGGNPFADPNVAAPPGDRATTPPPPPPPAPFAPATWAIDAADRSPPYPSAALRNEIEGQVMLKICVAPDGGVESVQLLRGLGFGCDEAAVAWAKSHWRFRPATRGGQPVRSCLMQPMRFQLQR